MPGSDKAKMEGLADREAVAVASSSPEQQPSKDARRRAVLFRNNLLAGLGYVIPILSIAGARLAGLTSFSWSEYATLVVAVMVSVGGFAVLIAVRSRFSSRFCRNLYATQFLAWLACHSYMISFLDEIRVAALIFSFIALVFLLSSSSFLPSLILALSVALCYATLAYVGIHYRGQSGSMTEEAFYLLIFLPIAAFIAAMASVFKRQREEIHRKSRELQETNKSIAEKNAVLEGLSSKLAKYLSPQVYTSIFSGKRDVKVESSRKKLTVFFSDIKGFTELTDSMEPEELSAILNRYLNEMASIALQHGGTIDKFIGDAIMIFFGDPESRGVAQDALDCVNMALTMRERVRALQAPWREQGIAKPMQVRMGISTGFCTVGNFGSEDRLDYTIVGGQVNLASRLESAAEPDQILISHETYALIKDEIYCEKKGEIRVKGIAYPVQTYQPVLPYDALESCELAFKESGRGFELEVDFAALKSEDRARLKDSLERLATRIRGLPE